MSPQCCNKIPPIYVFKYFTKYYTTVQYLNTQILVLVFKYLQGVFKYWKVFKYWLAGWFSLAGVSAYSTSLKLRYMSKNRMLDV